MGSNASRFVVTGVLGVIAVGAVACSKGGGGGGGSTAPASGRPVVLSTGAAIISADATTIDSSSAADRTRLGIPAFGRSYTLTTPANEAIDLSVTSTSRLGGVSVADGSVIVRVALGNRTGNAVQDFAASGISLRNGNLTDKGGWIETRGDGFVRLAITGAVAKDELLFVEREDGSGAKSHAVVSIGIGPRSGINLVSSSSSLYPGIGTVTDLYSSNAPVFGLPAICGNGDRVSVVCYDSSSGAGAVGSVNECCVPGVLRVQRRLQLDVVNGGATQGETVAAGHDAASWRDTEICGVANVIAVAQSGAEGLTVSISVDRGAKFSQTLDVAPGSRTRLARIVMAQDYTTGVLYWDFGNGLSTKARLLLAEGTPSSLDANNTPVGFKFNAPVELLSTADTSVPLVPDIRYTSCGDAFVAYGFTEQNTTMGGSTTRIGSFYRYAGSNAFTGPVTIDTIEMIAFDPSLAVVGCGQTAQVYVAYESPNGVTIKRSQDGAQSYPDTVRFGTRSAYGPRLFARPAAGGAVNVDCLFLDLGDTGLGSELRMFHSNADFSSAMLYRIIEAKSVTTTSGQKVDALGWFGFDATELNGKIYAVAHVQRTEFLPPFLGGPGMGGIMTTAGAIPPAAPVLLPGMTQPVPAFDATATHRLSVLEIN